LGISTFEESAMKKFQITRLEERIAPAPPAVLIPSVDLSDPGVNGAEHACKGLRHNHDPHPKLGTVQLFRHGCLGGPTPKPDPCGSVPKDPCGCS
jgi:hypothetical protein